MVTNKKSTFLLAIFLAQRNAFTFIFTYQVLDAPIFNFVIFLAEDIVKLLLARSCWKEISYDILGKEIFNKEQSCKISIVLFWPFKSDRVVNICSIRASLKKWHFKTMTRFVLHFSLCPWKIEETKKSQRKCCKVCIETLGSLSGMLVVMRNACKPLRAETKCHHKDSSLLLPQLQMASPSGLLLIENRSCNSVAKSTQHLACARKVHKFTQALPFVQTYLWPMAIALSELTDC